MKTNKILALMLVFVFAIGACNMPSSGQPTEQTNPNAVFTAAAQTVVAQLTQNALLNPTSAPATVAPPTSTPVPATSAPGTAVPPPTANNAPTAVPTVSCDTAQFVADVTIPDGTTIDSKATFVKTWRIKNVGTCTWTSSYTLAFDSDNQMGGPSSQPLTGTSVVPGGSVDISVNMQAPAADGSYRGSWRLVNGAGAAVPGGKVFVVIKVGTGGTTGGKFAVTSVSFMVTHSGACGSGKYTVTANITTNGAGDVTYYWIRSDNATDTATHSPVTFTKADTLSITTDWSAGATGLWMDLYVDKPNHQQFGRANLNCP